ncbi:MAG: YebC/PmpR family DNA-binding transcriptional regulator, partial [Synechococcus sp.]
EQLLENLIELDAAGYELSPTGATVHGDFTILEALQDGLRQQGWTVTEWGHVWTPLTSVSVSDQATAEQCLKLLDALEALDDVRSVSANLELDPELEID